MFQVHLQHYLKWLSSDRVDLHVDAEFASSRQVYRIVTEIDSGFTSHNKRMHVFSDEDEAKLKTSGVLSDKNPQSLLWKVWFDITYNLRTEKFPNGFLNNLTKDCLVLSLDEHGRYYTFRDDKWPLYWNKKGKMYEKPLCPNCPVKSTKLYLEKLSGIDALFQYPNLYWTKNQDFWYETMPVSERKLNLIMSEISKKAGLSKIYSSGSVTLLAKKHTFLERLKSCM